MGRWMSEREFRKEMRKDFNKGASDWIDDFEEFYEAQLDARDADGYVKYINGKLKVFW